MYIFSVKNETLLSSGFGKIKYKLLAKDLFHEDLNYFKLLNYNSVKDILLTMAN